MHPKSTMRTSMEALEPGASMIVENVAKGSRLYFQISNYSQRARRATKGAVSFTLQLQQTDLVITRDLPELPVGSDTKGDVHV